jgi:hypothetical protein
LKSVYEILVNNFSSFLEDIFIGERIHRLYFDDIDQDEPKIKNDFIYPIICKKYLILLPHDYKSIDNENLINMKQKYKRRIERFNNYIHRRDLEIYMIFDNINFKLNEFQKSVYNKFNIDITLLQNENNIYIDKIKNLYKDNKRLNILSLSELTNSLKA